MSKALIITEKPSVARDFARVLGEFQKHTGFLENDKYVISWCVGHLVGLVYPENYDEKFKKWKLEDLPFLPKDYKYDVIEGVKEQYDIVHGLLYRDDIDVVYWAGDAGKEGQTIEENIRNFGGVKPGMEEKRVWIDSQTDEELLRGIREAKNMSEYANLGLSGIMRTIEDYAMGINFSRALSVKFGSYINKVAGTTSYSAIAVGRVMTCVLGMIVEREREIRAFKETPFYKVIGSFANESVAGEWKAVEGSKYFDSYLLYKENGFKKEEDARKLIEELDGIKGIIEELSSNTSKKKAPLLFNLAELQATCSKRFKISPDETLKIAQTLYERKLTTYPRTDARVLTKAVAKEIRKNLSGLCNFAPVKEFALDIINNKKYENLASTAYVNDSKVTDHYAIIPTGQINNLQGLSELERNVYELIVRRFLAIFLDSAEYENVKMTVKVQNESFFSSGKRLVKPGYLSVYGVDNSEKDKDENDEEPNSEVLFELLNRFHKGDEIDVNGYELKEGKTSPPKRYTSGSMILAMENAGQLIEDEELRAQIKSTGIGTSATRAEIIDKLVRISYINLNRKTQVLSPEILGEMIYEIVAACVPSLLNPKMTASWEKGLDGITKGEVAFVDYREKLEDFIRRETLAMIGKELDDGIKNKLFACQGNSNNSSQRVKIGAKCPMCQGEIVTTSFGFGCENYKKDGSGCNFTIGQIAGKSLSNNEAKKLLVDNKTDLITGFVSKAGKKFDAVLKLEKDENNEFKISFDFDDKESYFIKDMLCPDCGSPMIKTPFGFSCGAYDKNDESSCSFKIGTICQKTIAEKEVKNLLNNGKTSVISGFVSKEGTKFDSVLKLTKDENGKAKIVFDFEDKEAYVIEGLQCPKCGSPMIKTSYGYACIKYDKNNEEGCSFQIGSICQKQIPENQVKKLLKDNVTDTIRGFTSKTGKKFDACLVLTKNENDEYEIKFDFEHVEQKKIKDVVCPRCGGEIVKTSFGYGCSNYSKDNKENNCGFSIGKIAGVDIKEADVKKLLSEGKTDEINGFKNKAGKKFSAMLALKNGEIVFEFKDQIDPIETEVLCPVCSYKLIKTKYYYECACGFKVQNSLAQKEIPVEYLAQLLKDGKTKGKLTGFISKSGNPFDAYLVYDKEKGISFSFD